MKMKIKVMGMSGQPEQQSDPETKAIPCPKCYAAMFNCTFYVMPHNLLWNIGQTVERGAVCASCGYTEFYATNPEVLITVSERRKMLRKLVTGRELVEGHQCPS